MVMFRSIFPQILFEMEGGGAAPAPAAPAPAPSAPADTGGGPAPGGEAGITPPAEKPREEPKLSLDDQLSKVWDTAHIARNERGQFAPKNPPAEGEANDDTEFAEGEDHPPADGEDQDDHPAGDADTVGAEAPTDEPPHSWSKDKAEVWASLTPDAKDYIRQRETEATQALSRAGRAVNTLRQYQPVLEAVQPFASYLNQVGQHLGRNPAQLVHDVLRFENTLRTAPDNDAKLRVVGDIIAEYGVDITPLIGPEAAQALQQRWQGRDPRVDELAAQVHQLTQAQLDERQAQADAHRNEMATHIRAAVADKVNFPHFAEVRSLMAAILQAQPDDGTQSYPQLIKSAYEQACRAHPTIWARIQADQRKQIEADARQAQRTDNARRAAAAHVKSAQPSPSKRSLDDTLNAIGDKHYRG